MRKFLRVTALTALAVGAMAMTAQAQEKTVSLLLGANFASLSGDDIPDEYGTRTGFVGGIAVGIPVGGGSVAIEPGVLYSMQGASYDEADFKGNVKVDYIKVPIIVKWSANPGGKGVYVMVGPSIGFNVTCSDAGDYQGTGGTGSYDDSCEDFNVKAKTTFSGDLGIGYTTGRVGIEGRYSFDWGDAFEITGTDTAADGTSLNIRNSVIQVLVRLTK